MMNRWRIASWICGVISPLCLVFMLILNPTTVPRITDTPWLLGFIITLAMAVILWARADRPAGSGRG